MGLILVVDDDRDVRSALRALLEGDGHRVIEAEDGVAALDEITSSRPDAMLLDIALPRLTGFDLLEQVRRNPATKSLPVIVVSSTSRPEDREAATRLGVVDYIGKPWKPDEIKLRVKWVLKSGTTVPAVPWNLSDAEQSAAGDMNLSGGARDSEEGTSAASAGPVAIGKAWQSIITPEDGGQVQTGDGVVRVDVPAGALRDPLTLEAERVQEDLPLKPAALRVKMVSKVAELTFIDMTGARIEGVNLNKPAKITIKYDERDLDAVGGEEGLRIVKFNEAAGGWQELPTTVDPGEGAVSTFEKKFSSNPKRMGGTVLVATANDDDRAWLASTMEGAGYTATEERDGGYVSKRVFDERPEVVLLALSLPRLDGLQVLRQIKSDPGTRYASVMLLTDEENQDNRSIALTLGARDLFVKPWHQGDFQRRVKRAFESARAKIRQEDRAVARARARAQSRRAA